MRETRACGVLWMGTSTMEVMITLMWTTRRSTRLTQVKLRVRAEGAAYLPCITVNHDDRPCLIVDYAVFLVLQMGHV